LVLTPTCLQILLLNDGRSDNGAVSESDVSHPALGAFVLLWTRTLKAERDVLVEAVLTFLSLHIGVLE
jgi:hypothetical protein